ncbi:unnamed protein product [Protopolystoma xenopodis]|uniref:Uncharacterized protein n=1 Tax=Protopolystoma xenopodis TaxID=117903 RepID=A0A3S4ZUU6_9PLAT|nr:unnamed protein product [Protopolystoma xenopodis]
MAFQSGCSDETARSLLFVNISAAGQKLSDNLDTLWHEASSQLWISVLCPLDRKTRSTRLNNDADIRKEAVCSVSSSRIESNSCQPSHGKESTDHPTESGKRFEMLGLASRWQTLQYRHHSVMSQVSEEDKFVEMLESRQLLARAY